MNKCFCKECNKQIKGQGKTGLCLSCSQKGRIFLEETRQKMSKSHLGHLVSSETREKMSKARKGKPGWLKGKTKENDSRVAKMAEKKKITSKKLWQTSAYREKVVESRRTPQSRQKSREAALISWQDSEYRKKNFESRKKNKHGFNKLEKKIDVILHELFRKQYKFVGDFQLWIGTKNPDFIDESKKKIIEFFGDYWHSEEKTGRTKKQETCQRINYFKKYGYNSLVIWESELENIKLLKEKIRIFHRM